jgi:HD-GYP domain-containing protein (c-di-GMP phosphodiesterase class II)
MGQESGGYLMTATISPEIKPSANPTSGYMTVQVEMLRRLRHSTVDLYIQYESGSEPVLYYRAGGPLEGDQVSRLLQTGVRQILVRTDEFHRFASHLLNTVDSDAERETVSPSERFAALQLAMAVEIEHAARLVDSGPYVAVADKLGRDLTSMLVNNNVLPRDLFRLARHDFLTFTHITNVASYGVIFAERLGLCKPNEYEPLAKAAILHDIGKRFIPANILQKPGKLDPEERAIIETHPQRGYEELCGRDDMTNEQLMMVYQHHERFDGKGYPVGFQGHEIHPWARMLAVVDVFDAMTGTRPYRRPATAADAMDYICKSAGTHFDPEMVACWKSIMSKH